ncbi:MAG: hypothetical protein RI985_221 [Chloroflexota bacterium]|jgi:HAD superfamily hydrolase (TIGR01509 family)
MDLLRSTMPVSTFIFDFDGTILDSESQDFIVSAEMWQAHGVELHLEEWRKGLGTVGAFNAYDALEQTIGRTFDRETWRTRNHARFLELCDAEPVREGVLALFDYAEANDITLTVGSSADRAWVTRWLTKHHLIQRVATIVTSDDVSQVKPSPEIFLTVAKRINEDPARCLVFEDSAHGSTAAARAGMRCVAVPIPVLVDAWMPPVTLRLRSLAELSPAQLLAQVYGQKASPTSV